MSLSPGRLNKYHGSGSRNDRNFRSEITINIVINWYTENPFTTLEKPREIKKVVFISSKLIFLRFLKDFIF